MGIGMMRRHRDNKPAELSEKQKDNAMKKKKSKSKGKKAPVMDKPEEPKQDEVKADVSIGEAKA